MLGIQAACRVLLLVLGAYSCGGDGGTDLAAVQVTPDPVTIAQQQTTQLHVSVLNVDGELVTGVPVRFASANPQIATVTNSGLVTGALTGSATIRVRA